MSGTPKPEANKPTRKKGVYAKVASAGPIEPGKLYSVDDFLARVRWAAWAFRTARRNGLKVIRTGGHAYIRGDDALAYFDKLAGDKPAGGDSAAVAS